MIGHAHFVKEHEKKVRHLNNQLKSVKKRLEITRSLLSQVIPQHEIGSNMVILFDKIRKELGE